MRVVGVTIRGAFSGSDDDIFGGLKLRHLLTDVENAYLPHSRKFLFLLTTFRPNKHRWYHAWHRAMMKTPEAFRARTRRLDRVLRRRLPNFDAVLQAGGLFAPF